MRAGRVARATGIAASLTLTTAVLVIFFGVLATSGVYGSRLAWLLGVALPLLGLTVLLAWWSRRGRRQVRPGPRLVPDDRHHRAGRAVLVAAASLFALPFALAALLLAADAFFFLAHGLRLVL